MAISDFMHQQDIDWYTLQASENKFSLTFIHMSPAAVQGCSNNMRASCFPTLFSIISESLKRWNKPLIVLLLQLAVTLTSSLIDCGNCMARYHYCRMREKLQQHPLMNFPKWYVSVQMPQSSFLLCSTLVL